MKSAKQIIGEHYGVKVTDQQVSDELANLKRKNLKGNLDDEQSWLYSKLAVAGHIGS